MEDDTVYYKKDNIENVLINSNFNCGFYINRENLFNILRFKYKINSCFDPCSYPGIQCKFYYNTKNVIHEGICKCKDRCNKKGKGTGENECLEISFMIFRTGSILIVGNCEENVLNIIYDFLKNMLAKEYLKITQGINFKNNNKKKKKPRKRTLLFK